MQESQWRIGGIEKVITIFADADVRLKPLAKTLNQKLLAASAYLLAHLYYNIINRREMNSISI
jgi:hypothetical protein